MAALKPHFTLLAQYNQWMNNKLYDAAEKLPAGELWRDRGAFFKSIGGTLNHLLVADTIWLRRFAGALPEVAALQAVAARPQPASLDTVLHRDLVDLRAARVDLDKRISDFIAALDEDQLARVVVYHTMRGEPHRKYLNLLLIHFFNHQTHHRGQITALLTQAGQDVGVTDVLLLIPGAE